MPLDLTVMEIFCGMYEDPDFYLQRDIYGNTLLENFIDNKNIKGIYALRVNQNSYSVPEEFRKEFKDAFDNMFDDENFSESDEEDEEYPDDEIIFEPSDFIRHYNYALKTRADNDVLGALRSLIHCGDERNYNLFLEKHFTKKSKITTDNINVILKILSFYVNARDYDGLIRIDAESLVLKFQSKANGTDLILGMVSMIDNRYFWAIVYKNLSNPISMNIIKRRVVEEDLALDFFKLLDSCSNLGKAYRLVRE